MRIQVVHDQYDAFGLRIVFVLQSPDTFGPVQRGMAIGHVHAAPLLQRGVKGEHMRHAIALIFRVVALAVACIGRYRLAYLAGALHPRLVHAHHRVVGVMCSLIHLQYLFQLAHEHRVLLWRDAPNSLLPRFDGVFLRLAHRLFELGARHAGVMPSLIVTCRLHEIDPYDDLGDVLQRVRQRPAGRVRELTPRLWKQLFDDPPSRSPLHSLWA